MRRSSTNRFQIVRGVEKGDEGEEGEMIYRKWSLLSSTVVIWGGVASLCLAEVFLLGGKEKLKEYLGREGERLRQQDRATLAEVSRAKMG